LRETSIIPYIERDDFAIDIFSPGIDFRRIVHLSFGNLGLVN